MAAADVFEPVVTRTATVIGHVWEASNAIVTLQFPDGGKTKLVVHKDTAVKFYCGRSVTVTIKVV